MAQQGTFHDTALEAQGGKYGITRLTPMENFPLMAESLSVGTVDGYVAEDTGFSVDKGDVAISVGLKKGSKYLSEVNRAISEITAEERAEMLKNAISLYETGAIADSDAGRGFFASVGRTGSRK